MKLPSLWRMQKELDQLFSDFDRPRFAPTEFSPSCEFSEDKSHYHLKFDLPGVKKEDMKIEVDGNLLSVTAERREEKKSEDKKSRYSEIQYGSYSRTFTLPVTIDEKQVQAKFENGVLNLSLPKAAPSSAKQIPVQ